MPLPVIISTPMILSFIVPYFSAFIPPAFVAMFPPIMHEPDEDKLIGKYKSSLSRASFRLSKIKPASTETVKLLLSISKILFIFEKLIIIS